jgi:protein-tyrosine-phosphatase
MTNTVTKDVKTQEQKDLEAAAIGNQPMNPVQAAKLAVALQSIGIDITEFKQAILTGNQADQVDAMIAMLNPFLWPDTGVATAPAQRAMPVKMNSEELKRQVKKASQDPYYQIAAGLTKGWPGPDAA